MNMRERGREQDGGHREKESLNQNKVVVYHHYQKEKGEAAAHCASTSHHEDQVHDNIPHISYQSPSWDGLMHHL